MKLQSVHLENYRCFENITIDFHKQLTVLVGANGSGKTAVLSGVFANIAGILSFVQTENARKYVLSPKVDRNFTTNKPLSMAVTLTSDAEDFFWKLPTVATKDKIRLYGYDSERNTAFLKKYFAEDNILPVIASYNSYRLIQNGTSSGDRALPSDRFSIYDTCFEPKLAFDELMTWLDAEDAREARAQRDGIQGEDFSIITAIREAIAKMLPGYSNFRFINSPPNFAVTRDEDGQTVMFEQLSSGYRVILSLVLDIAYRMAVANGKELYTEGKSVLDSPAIILIDEVDLYLHPSWQQRVLTDLMRTFPNAQFIVTTHSPQVLSAVKPEHIRILHDNKVLKPSHGTFGAESSRILFDVFGVQTRLSSLFMGVGEEDYPLEANIDTYFTYIAEDKYDSPEAMELRKELENILHDDPILARADAQIERARRLKNRRERHA